MTLRIAKRHRALEAERFFSNFRYQNVKILQKIARYARQGVDHDLQNQDVATDNVNMSSLAK